MKGISVEMVNAIRRIMLTEIPVMAIDEVIILKNDNLSNPFFTHLAREVKFLNLFIIKRS